MINAKLSSGSMPKLMGQIQQEVDRVVGLKLAALCPEILGYIYEDGKAWSNRLGNLSDSFGWAVYVRGKMVAKGYYTESPISSAPKKVKGTYATADEKISLDEIDESMLAELPSEVTGRQMVDIFLSNYETDPMNAYEVVFFAAMYYASFLEEYEYLMGFVNAEANLKDKVVRLFKSKRRFYYVPKSLGL